MTTASLTDTSTTTTIGSSASTVKEDESTQKSQLTKSNAEIEFLTRTERKTESTSDKSTLDTTTVGTSPYDQTDQNSDSGTPSLYTQLALSNLLLILLL